MHDVLCMHLHTNSKFILNNISKLPYIISFKEPLLYENWIKKVLKNVGKTIKSNVIACYNLICTFQGLHLF